MWGVLRLKLDLQDSRICRIFGVAGLEGWKIGRRNGCLSEAGFKDWIENGYKRKKSAEIRGNTQVKTPIKNPKQSAEIRRNPQKYPSKDPKQSAEIPKQKHPKQKHPRKIRYRGRRIIPCVRSREAAICAVTTDHIRIR